MDFQTMMQLLGENMISLISSESAKTSLNFSSFAEVLCSLFVLILGLLPVCFSINYHNVGCVFFVVHGNDPFRQTRNGTLFTFHYLLIL